MDESSWSARTILAIAAILATAAAVIVGTALFVNSWRNDEAADSPATTPPPNIANFLLDRGAILTIMGNAELDQTSDVQDSLYRGTGKVSPAECQYVDTFADAGLYKDVDWRLVRQEGWTETTTSPQFARQAVVLVNSEDSARDFLSQTTDEWQSCRGETYTGSSGSTFVMEDLVESDDTITAVSKPQGDTQGWLCEHALGVKSTYIAEAQVCGPATGRAQQIVEQILEKVQT